MKDFRPSSLKEKNTFADMVSIIIPTYNRRGLIKYTLDSLDAANHPGMKLEVIVVDDGSTDGVPDFIRENYPSVVLLRNPKKGAASARNTGLAAAKGEYVMYLDSDDLVGRGFFATKVACLDNRPDIDACYGKYEFFEADGEFSKDKIIFRHKYPMYTDSTRYAREHLENYLGGNFLPPNAIIWRRDFLLRRKGHDETLAINQDVEIFVRSIFNGLRLIGMSDDTYVYVRHHSLDDRVGVVKNSDEKWRQILAIRKKFFNDLTKYSFEEDGVKLAMATYLFNHWKMLRHTKPDIAIEYLYFAQKVYWPVPVKGGLPFRILAALLGPVRAAEIKYSLTKRD